MKAAMKLLSVLTVLVAVASALAGSLAGAWQGRIIVDRGQLPHDAKFVQLAKTQLETFAKYRLNLAWNANNTFELKVYKTQNSPAFQTITGDVVRTGDKFVLQYKTMNGKPKSGSLQGDISSNEKVLRIGIDGVDDSNTMIYFQFKKG